ncbi:MAG: hypothetical protein KF729_22750 [Sandaracinaceae bacterium]|nr:hypothetical protein [Sandaracinaceae bacterium]
MLVAFPAVEDESNDADNCHDGLDNDLDGLTDWEDPGCVLDENEPGMCADGRDNDGDGLIDYEDPGCWPYARVVVERCTRITGVDLRPFEDPGHFWAGAGTLVDRGDGFELEPDASGEAALLLIPPITGATRSLRLEVVLRLTEEAFEDASRGRDIVTIVRARDIGSDVRPNFNNVPSVFIRMGQAGGLLQFGTGVSDSGATRVGDAESGEVTIEFRIARGDVSQIYVRTATQEVVSTSTVVPWSPIDVLRLFWSAPPGVRVRSLRVQTDSADTCEAPPDLLPPPFSEPRAVAHGRGITCVTLADPTKQREAPTQLARSVDEGRTWALVEIVDEATSLRVCSGITWDEAYDVFRVACAPVGGGLVFGESADCLGWSATPRRPAERISWVVGYTMLGDQHELWRSGMESVRRDWTNDPTGPTGLVADAPEMLRLEDGRPIGSDDAVGLSLIRVGRDRLFVRSDGVEVSLVVATGMAGEAATVRTVIDPLLSPTGLAGRFDSGPLSAASATLLPSRGAAARLLVVYSGSTYCTPDACGQHASSAYVSILPP